MDIYQTVTDKIVAMIEAGAGAWHMPWHGDALTLPRNPLSGTRYRGSNVPPLWSAAMAKGYQSHQWATFKQWQKAGAQVRKGERSELVFFWKCFYPAEGGEEQYANEAPNLQGDCIQQRIGDEEGAGLSLGGLAGLASGRGDLAAALELYRQSLAAFEAIGDRAEEARILSEMAWTQFRHHDPALARRTFLDSVQAYADVASVRGVGLSLIGLAATEAVDGRPETAVQIASAAEVYAHQEGIVNVYSDGRRGGSSSTGPEHRSRPTSW